ncbi:MAG: DUF1592 domain-containing protein [Archangiaceae bacterium]|nr:DUF1592 domain-containing protein [Archangiaceae bacterium]
MRATLLCCAALLACDGKILGQGPVGGTPVGGAGGGEGPAAGCEPTTFQLTRLNRAEVDESLAQRFGDTVRPARLFSADTFDPHGFDNAAADLSISPRLVQDLEAAAPRVIDALWARDTAVLAASGGGSSAGGYAQTLPGSSAQATVGATRGSAWNLWSNGEAKFSFSLPSAGAYTVTITAYGEQVGSEPAHMDLWLNGAMAAPFDVPGVVATPTRVMHQASLPAGALSVGLRFTNDTFDQTTMIDRNLFIVEVKVEGAGGGGPVSSAMNVAARVCSGTDRACAEQILARFARRAWRRPVSSEERAGLLGVFDATVADGDDFETAVKLALRAVLVAPDFLIRTEAVMGGVRSGHAVASRLSYFLWGGPPDDALDARADDGSLADATVLSAEVERMLADPRAQSLRQRLVGQWLETNGIEAFALDPGLFPGIDTAVMQGAQKQIDAYIGEYFFSDHDALDAIDAPVTFADASLASFLGLPSSGSGLMRLTLEASSPRAGLLGQSAPLMVTSKSTETSPPRRGQYVLSRLLCQKMELPVGLTVPPVPPASANQPTARDRLEALTAPAACQGCHARLNPVGFALENFAADSRFRTSDHGATIDPKGTFGGKPVDGLRTLEQVLKADPLVERCMVEKALSFAIARPVEVGDAAAIAALRTRFSSGHRFLQLIADVAKSPLMVDGCRPTSSP